LLVLSAARLHPLPYVEAQRQVFSAYTTDMVTIPYSDSWGNVQVYVFFGTQIYTGGDADGLVLPTCVGAARDGTAFAAYGGQTYRAADPQLEAQLSAFYFPDEVVPVPAAYLSNKKGRFLRTRQADDCPFDVVTGRPRPTDPPNGPPLKPCAFQCAIPCAGIGIATVTAIALGVLCATGGVLFLTVPGFQATAPQILALCRVALAAALVALALLAGCLACQSACVSANRAMCRDWLANHPGEGA
jgi:hypothetical protein